MTATIPDTLNSLMRGELSAVETYKQALEKVGNAQGVTELRRIHEEHRDAVGILRDHVVRHGGTPEQDSGAWGTFAKAVEGTAKIFGTDAALKALKEGEEHGIKGYQDAIADRDLPADCRTMITSALLPKARSHVPTLDRLMAHVA